MQRILAERCRQERIPDGATINGEDRRSDFSRDLPMLTLHLITALLLVLTSTALAAPTVRFSTFLGGSAADNITDVAIDREGHIYVTGQTTSDNFPIVHALQDARAAEDDIFIAKFCPTGDTLEFCTYFGGNGNDQATGIAVDSAGRIWVCGGTTSTDLRMVMPLKAQNSGYEDALIVCLSSAGDSLLFSSYLGGNGNDRASDLVVDNYGSVGIVGSTSSSDFPTVSALIDTLAGAATDAFVCKINATSKALSYSTYFGGSGTDNAVGIVIDPEGAIYISGTTNSPDLPVVQPLQDTLMGGFDLFVAKIDPSGIPLIGSTYWGGVQDDVPRGMALASDGKVIIVGKTYSTDYPLHLPLQGFCRSCPSLSDGFVTAFDMTTGSVQFSTYLGGVSGDDEASAVVADKNGKIIVVGWTLASDFPTMMSLQSESAGLREVFVSIISSDGDSSEFSTLYGGVGDDKALAVAAANGVIIVAGKTGSSDFPLQNPWLYQYAGGWSDGFVARLDYDDDPSLCGDYDGSGGIDIADLVHLIQFIFAQGGPLLDGHNGDVDCDGGPSIADAVYLISYMFTHGASPCASCK